MREFEPTLVPDGAQYEFINDTIAQAIADELNHQIDKMAKAAIPQADTYFARVVGSCIID